MGQQSGANFGWIVTGNESAGGTAKQFDTKENTNPSNRPVLTIDYVPPVPDLVISKSHTGKFRQGDAADTYTITVSNIGSGATTGPVTVTDTLPAGLTPTAADSGTINGWSVSTSGQTITATRSDPLAGGASYPALTLTVGVRQRPGQRHQHGDCRRRRRDHHRHDRERSDDHHPGGRPDHQQDPHRQFPRRRRRRHVHDHRQQRGAATTDGAR